MWPFTTENVGGYGKMELYYKMFSSSKPQPLPPPPPPGSVVHPEQLRLNLKHILDNPDPPPDAAIGVATSMDRCVRMCLW